MRILSNLLLRPDEIFLSEHIANDLKGRTIRGGIATVGAQGIKFLISMVQVMFLARLLTPEDFGLIGMVMVVVNFASMFKDAGLSKATVQRGEISHEQISTLFWVNVIISLLLGIAVVAGAPLVAMFYGRPELSAVTMVLALSIILQGVTIQHSALLQRHMRFAALAVEQIAAAAIALIIAIILAWHGWNYWALVGASITSSLTICLLTFYFCPWLPGKSTSWPTTWRNGCISSSTLRSSTNCRTSSKRKCSSILLNEWSFFP